MVQEVLASYRRANDSSESGRETGGIDGMYMYGVFGVVGQKKERKREMERRDGEMRQKADCRLQMATVWCLVVFFFFFGLESLDRSSLVGRNFKSKSKVFL